MQSETKLTQLAILLKAIDSFPNVAANKLATHWQENK